MLSKKTFDSSENSIENNENFSSMQQGVSNIIVCVRVRPLTKKESEVDSRSLVQVLDSKVVILLDPSSDQSKPEDSFRHNRSREKQYAFDKVFHPLSSQQQIFSQTTLFLLEGVANGFNATVFAYGATGAGKTHTMIGDFESPGLMILTFDKLFKCLETFSSERQYKVKLSYLEIYNEDLRDLLKPSSDHLDVREDMYKGMVISGLSEVFVSSSAEVVDLIRNGNKNRTCESTLANEASSRSHAVLQIVVEYKEKAAGAEAEVFSGKLSLIDLAGSERASVTKNKGMRLIEGANINKSLLALGNCINALFENAEKGTKAHIPYRDSKLTRLLKDSLGGNCKTVMVACVSPCYSAFEDTHNTLTYANRAKNIKTNVQKNVVNVQFHIAKYTNIINQLRSEVTELRSQLHSKRNLPSTNIEKYLIVLNTHFQEEAKCRKNIHQIENSISQIGFVISTRQIESAKSSENSDLRIKAEIEALKKTLMGYELKLTEEKTKSNELENKRSSFENSWEKLGICEPYLSQLKLNLKKHILNLSSLDLQCKENQNKAVLEQKENYIKLLEEQLKIRDSILDITQEYIRNQSPSGSLNRAFQNLISLEDITAHSMVLNSTKRESLTHSLPPISGSRIPKIKSISPTSSLHSGSRNQEKHNLPKILSKKVSEDKYREGRKRRYANRIRSTSAGSSDSEESTASTYVKSEKKAQARSVAKKYGKYPRSTIYIS